MRVQILMLTPANPHTFPRRFDALRQDAIVQREGSETLKEKAPY
jgi:hypothetical protein